MRKLIGAAIIVGVLLGFREFYTWFKTEQARFDRENQYHSSYEPRTPSAPATPTAPAADTIPPLPPQLQAGYDAARKQGADAVRTWLNANRHSIEDPRLAAIELDYVVMVASKNFGEAREVFAAVQARTPTNSPLAPRIKKMSPGYR